MKRKMRKLELNRETLCSLEHSELPKIQGGAPTDFCTALCTARCTDISRCYQCMTDEPSYCVC
jgi:hypothetical protein